MLSIFRRLISLKASKLAKTSSYIRQYSSLRLLHEIPRLAGAPSHHNLQIFRHKSKSGKKQPVVSESETEDENNDWDSQIADKNTKIMDVTLKSMRIDGLLKAGLGIARNKIETLFYESKLRVNGQKVLKKSASAALGDEIDIIKGPSPQNPDFLNVARVEVLEIKEKGENLSVKLRRNKSLTIENYGDKWKMGSD